MTVLVLVVEMDDDFVVGAVAVDEEVVLDEDDETGVVLKTRPPKTSGFANAVGEALEAEDALLEREEEKDDSDDDGV
ncbi:hypothetical protein PYCC9005_002462 [Savitreella phatthalungensis]